jgi:hypothetical protein
VPLDSNVLERVPGFLCAFAAHVCTLLHRIDSSQQNTTASVRLSLASEFYFPPTS